jgi:purine-binding chemotaxis protein CheW
MSHRDPHDATPDSLQLVCFRVGDEEYGLDILRVREVVPALPITRVADAPAFLEGIVELRGAFFGVLDLRKRLGKRLGKRLDVPLPAVTPQHRYVVVRLDGHALGLVVDRVTEVRRVHRDGPDGIAPLAASVPGAGRLITGAVRLEDAVVLVLDLDHLLTAEERAALGPG